MPRRAARRSPRVYLFLRLSVVLIPVAWSAGVTGTTNAQQGGPCDPPNSNPIVCENQQPGDPASEWDVSGAGDPTIQGFATEISVDQGETIGFKIDTNATNYRLDIYRLGYYAGMGARHVATVLPSAQLPQGQPDCLLVASTGLIDCGNWALSASWAVPANAVSGIYFAKVTRIDSGGSSHIVFIVRDDDGQSDLLFQTSDTTWQAYNQFGGNSLYVGNPVGRAVQGELQPPVHDARDFTRGLGLQRRVPDGPVAGGQRVQRELHDGRRHGPARCGAPRASGFPVRGPRRVLVGGSADERRGGPGCRRGPRVLQRQRNFLEDALGRQHCGGGPTLPHAGQLQRNACQRQDRPSAQRVDGYMARSAVQSAGRCGLPRERAHRNDLLRQLRDHRDPCAHCRRPAQVLAEHLGRLASAGLVRDDASGHAGVRMGRGPGQRVPAAGTGPPVRHDGGRRRLPPGLRVHVWSRHRQSRIDALQAPQRRAGFRRGEHPVVVGVGRQSRPGERAAEPDDAAGHGEPVRRHGRAAGHAPGRPRDRFAVVGQRGAVFLHCLSSERRRRPSLHNGHHHGHGSRFRRRRGWRRGLGGRWRDMEACHRPRIVELLLANRQPAKCHDTEPRGR